MTNFNGFYKCEKSYFNNNKKSCVLDNIENNASESNNNLDIINSIFNEEGYPYDKKVVIKTKDNIFNTYIVTRRGDAIYTLEDEEILLKDIISIKRT